MKEKSIMGHKYSVILCTLAGSGGDVWEKPREVLETIAGAGYDAVDMDAEPDKIDPRRFKEVTDIAFSLGLKIPALIGAWAAWHAGEGRDLASSDDSVRSHAVNYAKKCIDLAASFDEPPLFEIVPCPVQPEYPVSSVPRDILRHNFVKAATEIVAYAGDRNVSVAIEPVNRFEAHAGFLNSIEETMSIVEEIGAKNLGVLADFFHVNIEDAALTDALRLAGSRLMHIHLADSNRQAPGTGHIDFLQVIRVLNAIDFTGYMSLDSVPAKPDWKTLVEESIRFMKQMEQTAALQQSIAEMH
jgi:sugar phosphate isomerase/epimerase